MNNNLCACGCNNKVSPNRVWVPGHNAIAKAKTNPNGYLWLKFKVEYRTWAAARQRCTNPNDQRWYCYGARGVKFKFSNFKGFLDAVGPKPSSEYVIDRINNDGHYEKGNVRWVTGAESRRNKRGPYKVNGQFIKGRRRDVTVIGE